MPYGPQEDTSCCSPEDPPDEDDSPCGSPDDPDEVDTALATSLTSFPLESRAAESANATVLPLLVESVPVLVVLVPEVVVSPVEDSKSEEFGVDPDEHKDTDKSESSDSVRFWGC